MTLGRDLAGDVSFLPNFFFRGKLQCQNISDNSPDQDGYGIKNGKPSGEWGSLDFFGVEKIQYNDENQNR